MRIKEKEHPNGLVLKPAESVHSPYEITKHGIWVTKRCCFPTPYNIDRLHKEALFIDSNADSPIMPQVDISPLHTHTDRFNEEYLHRIRDSSITDLLMVIYKIREVPNRSHLPMWDPSAFVTAVDNHTSVAMQFGYLPHVDPTTISSLCNQVAELTTDSLTVVHGDLRTRHIFWDLENTIKVIDWEGAIFGPSILEYASLLTSFPHQRSRILKVIEQEYLNKNQDWESQVLVFELARRMRCLHDRTFTPNTSLRGLAIVLYHTAMVEWILYKLTHY